LREALQKSNYYLPLSTDKETRNAHTHMHTDTDTHTNAQT